MSKQAFQIEGDFQMGRNRQNFRMEIVAQDEADAKERLFTDLGSRHSIPRRLIKIDTVKPIPKEEVQSHINVKRIEDSNA